MLKIILASTSVYRRQLIEKLCCNIEQVAPTCHEEILKQQLINENNSALKLAEELSEQKGLSVFQNFNLQPQELILSGDQLVHFNQQIWGKPQNFQNAFQQLKAMNNKWHELITSISLFSAHKKQTHTSVMKLKMRHLTDQEIENYLKLDQPYDCAGSYRYEKNGWLLFEKIEGDDLSCIQGVPMIWLTQQLKKDFNYELFSAKT